MDSSFIDLPGSEIEWIRSDGDTVTVRFSKAFIIKSTTGSAQSTRWYQAGNLVFQDAEIVGDALSGPLVCDGGDVGENVYTYRDMIPVPFKSQGRAHCNLKFRDSESRLEVIAAGVSLEMEDRPYYIEHFNND